MTSTYQAHLFRRVNQPWAARLQSTPVRRLLVVATMASLALAAGSLGVIPDDIWRLPVVMVPVFGSIALLNLSIRALFELDDTQLDEFQLAQRNAAYKNAYGFTLIFLVILATLATGLQLDRIQAFSAAMFGFLTVAMAPRLVVAWSMEDDLADPDDFGGDAL